MGWLSWMAEQNVVFFLFFPFHLGWGWKDICVFLNTTGA